MLQLTHFYYTVVAELVVRLVSGIPNSLNL